LPIFLLAEGLAVSDSRVLRALFSSFATQSRLTQSEPGGPSVNNRTTERRL